MFNACSDKPSQSSPLFVNANPRRAKAAFTKYGCIACHTIPAVPGFNILTAPPLVGISQRSYLAGMLKNTPENLRLWIQHPRRVNPHTAMPDQGVTDQDALDMVAYLYTTR
jgi:cytochrome c